MRRFCRSSISWVSYSIHQLSRGRRSAGCACVQGAELLVRVSGRHLGCLHARRERAAAEHERERAVPGKGFSHGHSWSSAGCPRQRPGAPITCTTSPLATPSGGFWMTRSFGSEAGGDLDHRAQVSPDGHGFQCDTIVAADRGDRQTLGIEDHRARGHAQHVRGGRNLQVDAGVVTRHQLAGAVVDDDLHECRAAARIHGLRGRLDRSAVGLAGMLGHRDGRLGARRYAGHVVLRHVDIDAKLLRFRDHEELGAAGRRRR